jgi:predicted N-acetyltransferase YhbS
VLLARRVLITEPMTVTQTHELVEPAAWSVRPELPMDLDQIHDLHLQAFRGTDEAELVDAVRAGAGFVPELSLVAVATDGSVLGHILVSIVGFDPDENGAARRDILALAPLAVLPPYWGRGIGSALMQAALSVADQRDEPFIAVLGPPSFYGRFDFQPAASSGVRSRYDAAGDAFQIRPIGDGEIQPGTVQYPPMFGEL